MTKTEMKLKAQEELLYYAGNAFLSLADGHEDDVCDKDTEEYRRQLNIQYARMQRLFGFMPVGYKG